MQQAGTNPTQKLFCFKLVSYPTLIEIGLRYLTNAIKASLLPLDYKNTSSIGYYCIAEIQFICRHKKSTIFNTVASSVLEQPLIIAAGLP